MVKSFSNTGRIPPRSRLGFDKLSDDRVYFELPAEMPGMAEDQPAHPVYPAKMLGVHTTNWEGRRPTCIAR